MKTTMKIQFAFLLCLISSYGFTQTKAHKIPFAGLWMNERYVNSIHTEQSPFKAQKVGEISTIEISTVNDTVSIGWNFHEGETLKMIKTKNGYQLNHLESSQTPLPMLYLSQEKKLKVGKEFFVKVPSATTENFLNTLLFKGNYQLGKQTITFALNGKLTGLGKTLYYRPQFDFLGGGLQQDVMSISNTPNFEKYTDYLYTFKGNILTLYQVNCLEGDPQTKECYKAKKGKEVYRFVKK
jgi:hypothetical protein